MSGAGRLFVVSQDEDIRRKRKLNKESYSEAQVTAHARPDDDGLGLMIRRGNL